MDTTTDGRQRRPTSTANTPAPQRRRRRAGGRPRLLLLASAAAFAVLPGAAGSEPIRIDGADDLGDLPTMIAESEDLFARHGLDAEVRYNPSGKHSLTRLRAGETDFALCALTPLVLDRLADASPGGGEDPVILGNLVHSARLARVVVRSDLGISDASGLAGRRIALAKGTPAEFLWWVFATLHRLDPASVDVLDRPMAEIPALIARGGADAAVVWEPWLARMLTQGIRVRPLPCSDLCMTKWVLVTTRETARTRPETARALLAAYRDAVEFIERHPEAALAHAAAHAGVDPATLASGWGLLDYDLGIDWSLVAGLQQQLAWARDGAGGRDAQRQAPVRVLSLIDSAPLRALAPWTVGIPQPAPGSSETE
jgi:NitT/TauT family transport system substrate-binding protein